MTSEPVFTPRSADAPEGDGWVTAVVYRAGEDRSDLLVFEAQDIAKGPIATAEDAPPRPVRLPRQLGELLSLRTVVAGLGKA